MRILGMSVIACIAVAGVGLCIAGRDLKGQDLIGESWKLEAKGDGAAVRDQLRRNAELRPNDPLALEAYATFLDRHRDPQTRAVYQKLSDLLTRNRASVGERARVARRLVTLDLIAGDRAAATHHLDDYRAAGGAALALPPAGLATKQGTIEIPGPLRSFGRMAAVSPEAEPEEVLAALAHNFVLNGYSASRGAVSLEPTEYLKLLIRYIAQAREVEKVAGASKMLRIEMCESSTTGDLLRVLGYRMRGGCGSDVVLETVNATRAFITIDSGFPLSDLEEALRTNRPFVLDYHPTKLPILFGSDYWVQDMNKKENGEFIDSFLGDPALCRLYSALSSIDPDTADQIHRDMPAQKAKAFAHVLDFFGAMFEIRGGKVTPPGGARSEKAWADLVGVPPERGPAFIERLFAKDDGWLAAYYDALARINGPVQDYLTEPDHLKRFYTALRGRVTSPGPARPVFRSSTDLVLLTARLRLNPDGRPHLPGGIEVWKNMYAGKAGFQSRIQSCPKAAPGWKEPEEVIEALFGLAKKMADNEPLKIFMALTDVERNRSNPLTTATVDALVRNYSVLGSQYALFADVPTVSDATIMAFLDAAHANMQMKDLGLRGDAAGTLQSLAAFWQIFVRQGSIAASDADRALAEAIAPFAKILNAREVFDAGQKGVRVLLAAARAPSTGSPQDHTLDLLAGMQAAPGAELSDAQQVMLQDMTRAFEAQRLVSLESLFTLADRLEGAAAGQKQDTTAMAKLATRISEIQLPRSSITVRERTEMSAGFYTERHIDAERKMNLTVADRQGRCRSGEAARRSRRARADLAGHAGGPGIHSLRASGSAGTVHESVVRSESRFLRHAGSSARVDQHGSFRQRLAGQRGRPSGGIAFGAAVRAGRSGTEFPHPLA